MSSHVIAIRYKVNPARLEGIEPPTYRFEVCRSVQLSYRRDLIFLFFGSPGRRGVCPTQATRGNCRSSKSVPKPINPQITQCQHPFSASQPMDWVIYFPMMTLPPSLQ